MSPHLVLLIFFHYLIDGALSAPQCSTTDEYCLDRQMHPDLPAVPVAEQRKLNKDEATIDYWRTKGMEFVKMKLSEVRNKKRARNVIMFLGDGMGLTTIAAARNLLGGEEQKLNFEDFPYTGLSKTYSVDKIVPDSACTATAYLCGVKAQEGTIGLNGFVDRSDCIGMKNESTYVPSIAKWAMDASKWAGLVTTTRVTHASPAGVYAHIAERDWENDGDVKSSCGIDSGVHDIAYQLMRGNVGSKLKLIMGGGRAHFIDKKISSTGKRDDNLDLIAEFKNANKKNAYVETSTELAKLNAKNVERVLGLFNDDHLLYHMETNASSTQPTLEEMTRKAIEILNENRDGYFLFVEGGRIDLAHHENRARMALDEAIEFSKAIAAARELTNDEETLIVVTADHSHVFSYAGYGVRGSDIFEKAPAKSSDGSPYLKLTYANGPSYAKFYDGESMSRVDPTKLISGSMYDEFPAGVPFEKDTHGGEDVAVYANGPWSYLFTGVYEQNAIPHFMAYAACLGNGLTMCKDQEIE